jgi:UDP-N-acetylmuramoyl-tripeptide--D-alanyl-D-alanine ligase
LTIAAWSGGRWRRWKNGKGGGRADMNWTVAALIEASQGVLIHGPSDRAVGALVTDTRKLEPGDCFVALVGERFDGHRFVADAAAKGAAAVVVEAGRLKQLPGDAVSVIEVSDSLYALGELARYVRRYYGVPVVGLTGSNGKTSTKEMIARILSQRHVVLKTEGNFNNLVGVPLTLLGLQPYHEIAVVEMGINVFGEMARLVEIAEPTVGIITNIHPAHLEGLESPERILQEKGGLWKALGSRDLAVVNLDDPRLREFAQTVEAFQVTYSMNDPEADVLAGPVVPAGWRSRFTVALGDAAVDLSMSVLGHHQVQNALAAAAVAYGMGEPPEAVAQGLERHQPVKGRMDVSCFQDGTMMVDDSYNANPMSVLSAVEALRSAGGDAGVVAVLGDMKELGEESASIHRDVGRRIGTMGLSRLITLGEMAAEIAEGAREAGMAAAEVSSAASHEEAAELLRRNWPKGAWILVKGSRSMAMERILEGLPGHDRMENRPA